MHTNRQVFFTTLVLWALASGSLAEVNGVPQGGWFSSEKDRKQAKPFVDMLSPEAFASMAEVALHELYFLNGPLVGEINPRLTTAVGKFQESLGHEPTGKLSGVEFVELWARSSADRVTPVYLPHEYLNLGSEKVFIVARPKATQDELCSSWTADRVSDLVKTGFKESFGYYQERAEQARAAKAPAFREAGKRITARLSK